MKSILIIFISCIVVSVWAHAGLSEPRPRGDACSETSDLAVCGLTSPPCADIPANTDNLPIVKRNTVNKFTIFQRLAHYHENNTYSLRIVPSSQVAIDSEWLEIITVQQNVTEDGVYFDIEAEVSPDLAIGRGVLQLIFDATAGGGEIYYSCADVIIQNLGMALVANFVLISVACILSSFVW